MTRPEAVKSLRDWVNRWPKADNLEFDAETREATVYTAAKRSDPARTKASTIPWRREGDVMTILTKPEAFTDTAVAAAKKRYDDERAAADGVRGPKLVDLRTREKALLDAWRTYRAAPPSGRPALMSSVLAAERSFMELEKELGEDQNRSISYTYAPMGVTHAAMIPQAKRVLKMGDLTGAGTV